MQQKTDQARTLNAVMFSLGFHASFLAAAISFGAHLKTRLVQEPQPVAVAQIEVAGASHAVLFELPVMQTAAQSPKPLPDTEAKPKPILPTQAIQPPVKTGGGAPSAAHAGDGSGTAQSGNGSDAKNANPAFPIFSPRPSISDPKLMPATETKIVVDVMLDAQGAVVSEDLVKGMGNALDQIVLDTVKTWRFQPATVNGKPVPTEAEVIVPFGPRYPITG
jgi:TonB family protein